MKRILIIAVACICLVMMLAGCVRDRNDVNDNKDNVTPTDDSIMDDAMEPSSTVMPELVPSASADNAADGNNDTAEKENVSGTQHPAATDDNGGDNAEASKTTK